MMRLAPVFLAAASLAFAGVDGAVVNGTSRQPQEGATVTLFQTTQQGPQNLGSVKTDSSGKFSFPNDVQPGVGGGPLLLQAVHAGVQYNFTIAPGSPVTGFVIPVYESSKKQGGAKVAQHIVLMQPAPDGTLQAEETYIFNNDSDLTWNDPDNGTMRFALPAGADTGRMEVNVTAPGGLPIRRAPDPAGRPNTFKLDFPIKPGESRVDISWAMPFKSPGTLSEPVIVKGGLTRFAVPPGVDLKGDSLKMAGTGPGGVKIYELADGGDIKVDIAGTGLLRSPDDQDNGGGGQSLSENLPKLYGLALANANFLQTLLAVKWVLLSVLGMLALGFVLLYRKGDPAAAEHSADAATKVFKHARGLG